MNYSTNSNKTKSENIQYLPKERAKSKQILNLLFWCDQKQLS